MYSSVKDSGLCREPMASADVCAHTPLSTHLKALQVVHCELAHRSALFAGAGLRTDGH